MQGPWIDRLIFIAWMALLPVTAFFSLRYIIRFGQQVKRNRSAGMYDDPEFKRRIRPLNILRYSLVGLELVLAIVAIWAFQLGLPPDIGFPILFAIVLALTIWLYIIDRRWRKLMIKGIEWG